MPGKKVVINYTNWNGETRDRIIIPVELVNGPTAWHPYSDYILIAMDEEKQAIRHFDMEKIHSWSKYADQIDYSGERGK